MDNLKGIFIGKNLKLVQKQKKDIGESGDYYYNLSFRTIDESIISLTAGKVADALKSDSTYDVGFDYINNKLKVVSFCDSELGKGVKA